MHNKELVLEMRAYDERASTLVRYPLLSQRGFQLCLGAMGNILLDSSRRHKGRKGNGVEGKSPCAFTGLQFTPCR
jgi:hypothetical protein